MKRPEERKAYKFLQKLSMRDALKAYKEILSIAEYGSDDYWQLAAALGRQDRFFLLTHLLHRLDIIDEWLYERCREVEANPDACSRTSRGFLRTE